jgi:hypothetical protein
MDALAQTVNLSAWQNFYVIVGSSGGALVGLQFVAIALLGGSRTRADPHAIHAFGTPNVVHFGSALTISALMCVPWGSAIALSLALASCGLFGVACSTVAFRRTQRQTAYTPVLEDWLCYAIVPCGLYAVLTVAAIVLGVTGRHGLFVVAGSTMGLLLIGLRNAWDTVTHIVVVGSEDPPEPKPPG